MWFWSSFISEAGLSTIHHKLCANGCIAADKLCTKPPKIVFSTYSEILMLFSKPQSVQASVCTHAMHIIHAFLGVYKQLPHLWIKANYWLKTRNFAPNWLLKRTDQKWKSTSAIAILVEYPPLHTTNNNNQ